MPRPLPDDGVRKAPLTTRWTMSLRTALDAEASRAGVSVARLLEVAATDLLAKSEKSRDRLLAR